MQTSSNFSQAELFTTGDGGVTWEAATAPAAGDVEVAPDGRFWLAGGVLHDRLYVSADNAASWSRSTLSFNSSEATVTAVAPPVGTTLAATVLEGQTARVVLLTTTDHGATWQESAEAVLAADPGQTVPAALGDTGVLITDPAAARVYRSTGAGVALTRAQASDVPPGIVHISTSGDARSAWALSTNGACARGKQDCATSYALAVTNDAGSTWHVVLSWQEDID